MSDSSQKDQLELQEEVNMASESGIVSSPSTFPHSVTSPPSVVALEAKPSRPKPKRRQRSRLSEEQLARKRETDREAQRLCREKTRRRFKEYEDRLKESEASVEKHKSALRDAHQELNTARLERRELLLKLQTLSRHTESLPRELDEASLSSDRNVLGHSGIAASAPNQDESKAFNLSLDSSCDSSTPSIKFSTALISRTNGRTFFNSGTKLDHVQTSVQSEFQEYGPQSSTFNPATTLHNAPNPIVTSFTNHVSSSFVRGPDVDETSQTSLDCGSSEKTRNRVLDRFSATLIPSVEVWDRLPLHTPPSGPFDEIFHIFIPVWRDLFTKGVSHEFVLGPLNPDVTGLLSPPPNFQEKKLPPLVHLVTDLTIKAICVQALPEQIASFWLLYLILRWQTQPNQANWDAMPEWFRPLSCQRNIAHPTWMDCIVWPGMRNITVRHHEQYNPVDFWSALMDGWSVNWTYGIQATVDYDEASQRYVINPEFQRHVCRLENWSPGPGFVAAFPSLVDTYVVRD